jgi:hypothetical protein
MKAYWASGGIAPRILDSGTKCGWVVSFTPRPLYPLGKSPWYPLDRRLGGHQSHSGLGWDKKNSQPLSGLEPPIIQLVAERYTTDLSRLLSTRNILTQHHTMKAYWEWRYSSAHSLTSALDGGEWSASRPGCFTPRERAPDIHWIGDWVGPRAVLDAMVKKKIPSPC